MVTPNQLQSWRFVGTNRAIIRNEERSQEKIGAENPNEKSQWYTVTEDIKEEASSGQDKVQEMTGEVPTPVKRKVEDGILVVVPARIYGKQFRALIDSGATRCFVSPNCIHIAGLSTKNWDTFLELGNGAKVLSRAFVPEVLVVVASNTSKINLTVSQLMYDTDIILGLTWLKTVNPIVDWLLGKLYVPNAINTSLILGEWMDEQVKIGTVQVLSNEDGLQKLKDQGLKEKITVLKSPKFWTEIYDGVKNSRTNLSKGDAKCKNTCKNECNCQKDVEDCDAVNKSCKLFIRTHPVFGSLYIKKYVIMLPFHSEEQKIPLDMT